MSWHQISPVWSGYVWERRRELCWWDSEGSQSVECGGLSCLKVSKMLTQNCRAKSQVRTQQQQRIIYKLSSIAYMLDTMKAMSISVLIVFIHSVPILLYVQCHRSCSGHWNCNDEQARQASVFMKLHFMGSYLRWGGQGRLSAKQWLKWDWKDEKPGIVKIRGWHSLGRRKIRRRRTTTEWITWNYWWVQRRPVWLECGE